MTLRKIHDLRNLGFRHFVREDTHDGEPLFMHSQHEFERLRVGHTEEAFKHMHNKFHRRVVVVQQHHLVHRRPLSLGARLQNDPDVSVGSIFLVCHHEMFGNHIGGRQTQLHHHGRTI